MKIFKEKTIEKLSDLLEEISTDKKDTHAAILPLSVFGSRFNNDFQFNLIGNILNETLMEYLKDESESYLFFSNIADVILIIRKISKKNFLELVEKIKYLFLTDQDKDSKFFASCKEFNLELEIDEFNQYASELLKVLSFKDKNAYSGSKINNENNYKKLSIDNASKIISRIINTDCLPALRSQPICILKNNNVPKTVIYEIYFNISHITKLLYLNENIAKDPILFKQIAPYLDEKIFNLILSQNNSNLKDIAFSLNLSPQTIISDNFIDFRNEALRYIKNEIIVEIQISDVFIDSKIYKEALKKLEYYNYRLCLDGLNSNNFNLVDRKTVGFDIAKLQWEGDETLLNESKIAQVMENYDENRVILTRCDNIEAINFGKKHGISLFQGRYIDKVINPNLRIEN